MNIAKFFHQKTKIRYKKDEFKPSDSKTWPKEWRTIYFKEYPRFSKVLLPNPGKLDFPLQEAILLRRSEREFSGEPLNLEDLSRLLFYSAGVIEKREDNWNMSRRTYPSAGARFPLEIYLFNLKSGDELKEGIYHYNVKEHSLEKLPEEKNLREKIYPKTVWQDIILKAPLVLVISAVFERNMMKYKDRGYRYILFEAGHLGQNLYLVSKALSLKCCAIGGFDDDRFNELLDIDGQVEGIIYAFALGY